MAAKKGMHNRKQRMTDPFQAADGQSLFAALAQIRTTTFRNRSLQQISEFAPNISGFKAHQLSPMCALARDVQQ
jgi:hypothetical protein